MPLDPRTPVIVGAGQSMRRPSNEAAAAFLEPAVLMAEAAERAATDCGAGRRALEHLDSIAVVNVLSWRHYRNPALAVAELLGVQPRRTVGTTLGGNSPQMLVAETAAAIARGELDLALVCGAEAIYSRLVARKLGMHLNWSEQDPATPPPEVMLGDDRAGTTEAEQARSLSQPIEVYPILECALRIGAQETFAEHQVRISELWARFSAVAAMNPNAWSAPRSYTAEQIRTPSPANRMVGLPYPKLMNANIQTDQGAALLICSVAAARSMGVSQDRWVFPLAAADAHDTWWISERFDLARSPAIAACGSALGELARIGIDDVAHLDLYSCFPSAVQIAAGALGLALDDATRPLTVTGGLTFSGGPGNNYVMHAIATMTEVLRRDPGSVGLISGLGWYVTKHHLGLYSTTPPAQGFLSRNVQAEADAHEQRRVHAADYSGPVHVEAWTVMHDRDGAPELGIVACVLDVEEPARTWANTRDPELLDALCHEDLAGQHAVLRADGELAL